MIRTGPIDSSSDIIALFATRSVAWKRSMPNSRARSARMRHERLAEAEPLPVVGHNHGRLGDLGLIQAYEPRHAHGLAAVLVHGEHSIVVAVVDVEQVAELRFGQAGDGGHEPLVDGLLAHPLDAGEVTAPIVAMERRNQRHAAVAQGYASG